jgi:peroxisomal 3,2-trans-enoyl-CoA isomerase
LCKSEVVQEPVTNSKFKEIVTSIEYGNIYKIVLNRPNKRNALNLQVLVINLSTLIDLYMDIFKMYVELQEALKEAESNPNVLLCCLTGAGDFYCAGNDLSNFTEGLKTRSVAEMAQEGRDLLE